MRAPGRPIATTFEMIEAVALRQPERVALVEGTEEFTFSQLHVALARFSIALERLGVRRGKRVAVSRPSFFVQVALLIACENVGAVSVPFKGDGDPDLEAVFGLVDWVLSECEQAVPQGVEFQLLDADFLRFVLAIDARDGAAGPRVALEMHEAQRITRTSGSTGTSKFMVLTRQAMEHWIFKGMESGYYTQHTRLMIDGPLVMTAAFTRTCGCLRVGGCVLVLSAQQLAATRITHLWALPVRLAQLLDELPAGYVAPAPVQLMSVGASVPGPLRQRTIQMLRAHVINRYGANECGSICDDLDASGCGLITAGVDLRVVDEQGGDVPAGEVGVIAVRTPAMVEGYLNAPQESAVAFRDGWFYSGDLGALVAPRTLRLAGRHDDLLNLGGIKVAAAQVEAQIKSLLAVHDCAVLAVNLPTATVGVVLAIDPGTPEEPLRQQLAVAFNFGGDAMARVVFVEQLPRMESGKLDRLALQRLLRESGPH